jgi:hypothetical protein
MTQARVGTSLFGTLGLLSAFHLVPPSSYLLPLFNIQTRQLRLMSASIPLSNIPLVDYLGGFSMALNSLMENNLMRSKQNGGWMAWAYLASYLSFELFTE